MNTLAICSALNNSYIAFDYDGEKYYETIKSDEKNYHSLYLISHIKKISEERNIKLKNLDILAVNCGPGSFTGIRVAMTVMKVLAGELNLPLISLNTSEILLNAFDCEKLIMDARRDMYFLGTKDNIELIYKDKINNIEDDNKILTDKRSKEIFKNSICYEEVDKNLGEIMLKLAQEKYSSSENKNEFNYLNVKANYIQTPPVF